MIQLLIAANLHPRHTPGRWPWYFLLPLESTTFFWSCNEGRVPRKFKQAETRTFTHQYAWARYPRYPSRHPLKIIENRSYDPCICEAEGPPLEEAGLASPR